MGKLAFVFLLLLAGAVFAANISVDVPVKEVTIYSNGYAFVKRDGNISSQTGRQLLHIINFTQSALENSLSVRDSGAAVYRFNNYQLENIKTTREFSVLSFDRVLNASLGRQVTAITDWGNFDGELVWFSYDMVALKISNTSTFLKISDIKQFRTPLSDYNESIEKNETEYARGLAIYEQVSGESRNLKVSYLVRSVDWTPTYKYYLGSEQDSGTGALEALANVESYAGEDWKNVKLKLVVGYPNIIGYYYAPERKATNSYYAAEAMDSAGYASAPSFSAGALSGYYVYELSEPADINHGDSQSLSLFSRSIPYRREYVWYSYKQYPEKVFYLNNTGTESWGVGKFSVYIGNEFLGENNADYTGRNKEAEISVSEEADLSAEKETVSSTSTTSGRDRITTYRMKLTVTNSKSEAVTLRIVDQLNSGDEVKLVSSSVQAVQKPENILEWTVTIGSGATQQIDFEYQVINHHLSDYSY